MDAEHLLTKFGLTRQEALLYTALLLSTQATGYEVAKQTGISRSNAYAGLSSLVEKGAAYSIDGKPARYEAVPVAEFCRSAVRGLQSAARELESLLPPARELEDAYLTIRGDQHIRSKIESLLLDTRYRAYLSMPATALLPFLPLLEDLAAQGKKVVVIADSPLSLPGATVYRARGTPDAIRMICDSRAALTGTMDGSPHCTCLFSLKENLVSLLKDSIKNEIRLIPLEQAGQ